VKPRETILLFDGVCNLCNSSIRFVHKRAKYPAQITYHSLQSEAGKSLLDQYSISKDEKSVVVIQNNKAYLRSNAGLAISKILKFPYPIFYVFKIVPRFIRDVIYNYVAKNRYKWYGKREDVCEYDPEFNTKQVVLPVKE